MDLPTCPACKQSVLDEDAAECPFCGAAMKGGTAPARASAKPVVQRAAPQSAPPARLQPAAGAAATASRPETAPPKPAPSKPAAPADDDPFAVDAQETAKAVPVSAKPAAGKTLEVKCPMCETTGYVSQKAAGQQVRCCNPDCLVPVFKAPAPKKVEAPPPPPEPKKLSPLVLAAVIAVALGGGGGLVWYFSGPPTPPAIPSEAGGGGPAPVAPIGPPRVGPGVAPKDGKTVAAEAGAAEAPRSDPRAELTNQALKKITSLAVNVPQTRKAYTRRLAAVAHIESGELAGGREQIGQLQKVGAAFEASLPTVMLAWKQIESPDEFKKSVADAVRLAGELPPRGRYAVEAGLATAALLTAAGQLSDAQAVLAKHKGLPELRQLAAASQVVQHDGSFDLDAPLIGRSLGGWLSPLETGVTLVLIAHGRWDDARTWADGCGDANARAEATLAWAEAFARRAVSAESESDLERAQSAAMALPAAVQARLLARLAAVQLATGNNPAAEELLQQALTLIQGIAPPAPVKIQSAKALLEFKLPDPSNLRWAALAAAEIGAVQAQLKQPEAWGRFELALKFLRGAAPSLSFARAREAQAKGSGAEAIRNELKAALQLKTSDAVRRSFSKYQDKTKELTRAAVNRLLWEAELLDAAARLGLGDAVWNEILAAESKPDLAEREPLLMTRVPVTLMDDATRNGDAQRADEIWKAAQAQIAAATPDLAIPIVDALTSQSLDAGDVSSALKNLNEGVSDSGTLDESALRLACRLVKADRIPDAIQFVRKLKEVGLREDGLYLVCALAARSGHEQELWKLVSTGMNPTETMTACAGLVVGMSHAPDAPK